MSIRILTKNGIDNTNIDGARDHNFNAGRRSGIVKGVLNECNIFSSSSNTIAIDTCELRLCGHRIVIDETIYKTFSNSPASAIRYSIVARVVVDSENNVSFDTIIKSINEPLSTDNLDKTGFGTFELELGRFTLQTDGTITDIVRTADIITGGIGDLTGGAINIGNVTTNTLEAGMEAEVDVEQRYDEQEKKTFTDFSFSIPKGDKGEKGDTGSQGLKGDTGLAAGFGTPTASVDDNVGTPIVNVTASGEDTAKVFNFEFKNLKGQQGDKGNTGLTPQISTTATTLPAGSSATATITGSAETPTIAFGIPKGDKGEKGDSGLIYQTTGQNTDGAISQKATTDELDKKLDISGGYMNGTLRMLQNKKLRFDTEDTTSGYYGIEFYGASNGSIKVSTDRALYEFMDMSCNLYSNGSIVAKKSEIKSGIKSYLTSGATTGSGTSGSLQLTLGHMYILYIVDGVHTFRTLVRLSTDSSKTQYWYLGIGAYGHYMRLYILGSGVVTYQYANVGNTNWTNNNSIQIYYEDITGQ